MEKQIEKSRDRGANSWSNVPCLSDGSEIIHKLVKTYFTSRICGLSNFIHYVEQRFCCQRLFYAKVRMGLRFFAFNFKPLCYFYHYFQTKGEIVAIFEKINHPGNIWVSLSPSSLYVPVPITISIILILWLNTIRICIDMHGGSFAYECVSRRLIFAAKESRLYITIT